MLKIALEFLGIWLALLALLGQLSDVAPAPARRAQLLLYTVLLIWLLVLVCNALVPRFEARLLGLSESTQFESGIILHGHRINIDKKGIASRLYILARQEDYIGLGYSVHLIDQAAGDTITSLDQVAEGRHTLWLLGPDYVQLYRQTDELKWPPQLPVNRALWVVLSLWHKQDGRYMSQKVLSSDHRLLSESQVILGELVLPAVSAASSTAPLAAFDNGYALEAVELPQRALPGET